MTSKFQDELIAVIHEYNGVCSDFLLAKPQEKNVAAVEAIWTKLESLISRAVDMHDCIPAVNNLSENYRIVFKALELACASMCDTHCSKDDRTPEYWIEEAEKND